MPYVYIFKVGHEFMELISLIYQHGCLYIQFSNRSQRDGVFLKPLSGGSSPQILITSNDNIPLYLDHARNVTNQIPNVLCTSIHTDILQSSKSEIDDDLYNVNNDAKLSFEQN